jgi:hypothetical protein
MIHKGDLKVIFSPHPKGITTSLLNVEKRKIGNFSLLHIQQTCEKDFFWREKNPG